ncbi:zinc finger protein 431 [Plutella xylostella]|uniref:zinc finger protein 431 n=1 Tax=Plutella xylostella TaxID=51655 RepID=UPI00203230AF|nr:zinc finger protein 431 [Plutella xylostella]
MELTKEISQDTLDRLTHCNMVEACRICMARGAQLSNIFSKALKTSIKDMIQFCTGLQLDINDGLPSQICDNCLSDLNIAHRFKSVCLTSDETFRKLLLETKVKVEPTTEDDITFESSFDGDFEDNKDSTSETKAEIKDEILEAVLSHNAVKTKRKKKKVECLKTELESDTEPTKKGKEEGYQKFKKKSEGNEAKLKSTKYRRLFCEPCQLQFSTKQQSDLHKKQVHVGDNWICEICGKVFAHRASHYSHIRSHLPPRFACAHCLYVTWNKHDLVKHVAIHTGDYVTWNKHDLVKHVAIHTGIKQYQCEFCTNSYFTSSNLTSHIRRSHHSLKNHRCHICGHRFFENAKLQRHLDSHNDIKRYACDVCHSLFSRRYYWKKHLQKQHGIEVPKPRPGRKKTNYVIGQELLAEKIDIATHSNEMATENVA